METLLSPERSPESLETETVPPRETPPPEWGAAGRIAFRFVCLYLLVYNLSVPLSFLPFLFPNDQLASYVQPYADFWHFVVPRVGRSVFALEITVFPNGSGDTTYNYVEILCYAVLAAAAALLWTALDRKRRAYPRLHDWLRVYVRLALGTAMILYGSVKVIKSQFPDPGLDRLLQPFGDASPMGLLWTFMGASESYNLFTGAGEMLGGLLLLAGPRTVLLGALVSAGVLGNVVMLNFSYDVPVKLYSLHLLGMALFLAAPDLARLANFFVFNRRADRADIRPLFRWPWANYAALALRLAFAVAFTARALWVAHEMRSKYGDLAERSPLYGVWEVEKFEVDGKDRPPLVTDAERWRRLVFTNAETDAFAGGFSVQLMNDSRRRFNVRLKAKEDTLTLTKRDDPAWKVELAYQRPEPDRMLVEGTMDGHRIKAEARRRDTASFVLTSRGFHWINEYPFNR